MTIRAGPLEDLKSRVQLLTFCRRDPLLALPEQFDLLDVLYSRTEGRTVTMLVRELDDDFAQQMSLNPNLFDVQAIRPSLEELYIGFTRREFAVTPPQAAPIEIS